MYYKMQLDQTSKPMGRTHSQEDYCQWNSESITFATLKEVKRHLNETYGNCKRVNVYRGEGELVGKIFCYKHKQDYKSYFCQDWITITEVTEKVVIV